MAINLVVKPEHRAAILASCAKTGLSPQTMVDEFLETGIAVVLPIRELYLRKQRAARKRSNVVAFRR